MWAWTVREAARVCVCVCVQVMAREAESSLSGQQRSNFKMVVVNNKPMHSWYNWLTDAGISEDQVEVCGMLYCAGLSWVSAVPV